MFSGKKTTKYTSIDQNAVESTGIEAHSTDSLLNDIKEILNTYFGKDNIRLAFNSNTPCQSRVFFSWFQGRQGEEIKIINTLLNGIKNLKDSIQEDKIKEIILLIIQCFTFRNNLAKQSYKNFNKFSQLLDGINRFLVEYMRVQTNFQAFVSSPEALSQIFDSFTIEKTDKIEFQEKLIEKLDKWLKWLADFKTKLKSYLQEKESLDDIIAFLNQSKNFLKSESNIVEKSAEEMYEIIIRDQQKTIRYFNRSVNEYLKAIDDDNSDNVDFLIGKSLDSKNLKRFKNMLSYVNDEEKPMILLIKQLNESIAIVDQKKEIYDQVSCLITGDTHRLFRV